MKKQVTIMILAAAMLIPSAALADTTSVQTILSDWAVEEMERANNLDLIPPEFGISDYTKEIKRDKFCELALQLIKAKETDINVNMDNPFTDTDNEAVMLLAGMGIINGKGDGKFAPSDDISREEAATILYRMAEFMDFEVPEINEIGYDDANLISDWAKNAVSAMRQMAVMNGTSERDFTPKGTYTAEQAMATMVRLYEYAENTATPEPTVAPAYNSLNDDRRSHMSVTVGDKVYVIGGTNESGELVNNIEVCNGGTNYWSYECTSDYITESASAVVGGNTIYIIGGKKDNECIDTISAYDTETKEWSEVGNILTPVESAKAAYFDNKIYITDAENTELENIIVYDLESGAVSDMDYPEPLDTAIPVVCNDMLYLFGVSDDENRTYVFENGTWELKSASPAGYRLGIGQSDGDMIYFSALGVNDSVLEYDTVNDTWRNVMDSYIKDKAAYGFALCRGYVYITGGIDTNTLVVKNYAEPYYYKWTYADYDADSDIAFKKTIGFDYEPNGTSFDVKPEILTVNVKILDAEKGIYELSMPEQNYVCDEAATPYFFWESYSGCFDGANPDHSRVIYHAAPDGAISITVGMGDGSGWTDKKKFTIPRD